MEQLFKENRLAKGKFVGLGRTLNLRDIKCPAFLLAGADDDITTPEQVLDAANLIGTPKDHRPENRAGRPYRTVHGRPHVEG